MGSNHRQRGTRAARSTTELDQPRLRRDGGLEPPTSRLRADRSTTELIPSIFFGKCSKSILRCNRNSIDVRGGFPGEPSGLFQHRRKFRRRDGYAMN